MSIRGWPFGDYPDGGLEELGPHVTAYYGDSYPISNSAIVRGAQGTLVFDANTMRFARTLRAAVDAGAGPPLRYLVLSHIHDDHSMGSMHFAPPAWVTTRAYTIDRLSRWVTEMSPDEWAQEYRDLYEGADAEARELRVVVPDDAVETEATIDLGGGVMVRLFPVTGSAHTKADLWALVEPDGVALCGDLWFNRCEPYLASGSAQGALRAIALLRAVDAAVYLPGHGPAGALRPAGQDPVERYCTWLLEEVRDGVEGGVHGPALRARIRERLDREKERPGGVGFDVALPGFLEEAVEAEERALALE